LWIVLRGVIGACNRLHRRAQSIGIDYTAEGKPLSASRDRIVTGVTGVTGVTPVTAASGVTRVTRASGTSGVTGVHGVTVCGVAGTAGIAGARRVEVTKSGVARDVAGACVPQKEPHPARLDAYSQDAVARTITGRA
jgi:hypothetical protein